MRLPESLRHHEEGRPEQGWGRSARGLLLRGVVSAVYLPEEYPGDDRDPALVPGVTCDVLIASPIQRTILPAVPIALQSAGYEDAEVWVPQATTGTISGAPLSLIGKGGATAVDDMNGDHVLVGFINGDMGNPVILAQLPHPKTTRRPTDPDLRYERTVSGSRVSVYNDGGVVVSAGSVVITNGVAPDPERVILGETFLTDLLAALTEIQSLLVGLGLPTTALATLIGEITTSLGSNAPYLSSVLETD